MYDPPRCFRKGGAQSPTWPVTHFQRRSYLARRGDPPKNLWFIEEGWAIGYKLLRDGRRHISRLYLPGDFCELTWIAAEEIDQMVMSSTSVRARKIDRDAIKARLNYDKELSRYLAMDSMAKLQFYSDWVISLGCKTAAEKVAQLFCELFLRLNPCLPSDKGKCDMPLSQQEIAEITGMTPVHVCRTIRDLRKMDLIELKNKKLHFLNFEALAKLSGFEAQHIRPMPNQQYIYQLLAMKPD